MKTQKLYLGLTRPPQIVGMSHESLVLMICVSMMLSIFIQNNWILLSIIPLFYIFRYLNKKDYFLINIFFTKSRMVPMTRNYVFWGNCNSYDPIGNKV